MSVPPFPCLCIMHVYLLFTFKGFIFRRGEGKEKERVRNTDVREKHQSVTSWIYPDWGPNL